MNEKLKRGGPRPMRWSIPIEVIPKVDQLIGEGHPYTKIAVALGCDYQTIRKVHLRIGAYAGVAR